MPDTSARTTPGTSGRTRGINGPIGHALSGLIERRHLNVADYVQHLEDDVLPGLNADEVSGGTPVDWVNESHQIAQDERVENNTRLSSDYIENAMTIVDQRLARGGLRLAKFIEDALAEN